MSDSTLPGRCPDCHTLQGQTHEDGCDVARCTICGTQRITCIHGASDRGWGQIWIGIPPPQPAYTVEEFILGAHLTSGCLTCANARRRSEMCADGKTLYDDMIAAQYAANRKGTQ